MSNVPAITMRLFPVVEPREGTATLFQTQNTDPSFRFFTGGGQLSLLCGRCDRELCKNLDSVIAVANVVFRCPKCGQCNATRE